MTTSVFALPDLIRACTSCPARMEATKPVPFEGSIASRIMFVGRNPGRQEDKSNRPFVGPGGELLHTWLERAGLDRGSVMITNLLKCYTENDRPPKDHEIKICSGLWLHNELSKMTPKIVVPLGKQAMHYFLPGVPVSSYQGVWYPTRLRTLFYLHHPGYILRGGFPREDWLDLANKFKNEHAEFL